MRLSWSHKLFFLANRYIGRSRFFDESVIYFAKDAIVIMVIVFVWQMGNIAGWSWLELWKLFYRFAFGAVPALTASWIFGWLYPHRRPIAEFPEVKEIVKPLSNWKSLPSDHTIFAGLFFWFVFFLGVPASTAAAYLVPAVFISVARVFAGVHYPRDIVAGWIVATVAAFIFWR